MFEHACNLFAPHPRKPFEELIDCGSGIKILEERTYWDARTFEKPCAAQLVFVVLNFSAISPVQHTDMICFALSTGKDFQNTDDAEQD